MKLLLSFILCLNLFHNLINTALGAQCVSKEGITCGGLSGIKCCTTLSCIYSNNSLKPSQPNESGRCASCSGLGDICSGFGGFRCCPSLKCKMESTGSDIPDASGTCVSASTNPIDNCSQNGKMCGGIAGIQCCKGLRCVIKDTYPDASGICRKRN